MGIFVERNVIEINYMKKLKISSFVLLVFMVTNCTVSDKNAVLKKKNIIITTYLQVDTMPMYKHMVETQDLTGKTLERISYFAENGLIRRIENTYYDSLKRNVLTTVTSFPPNKTPNSTTYQKFYNSNGLISKFVSSSLSDTNTIYFDYLPNKKLQQTKTLNSSEGWWEGITKYFYDKNDSLIKLESWNLDGEQLESRDSIVYTDTSKVVFEFHYVNELSSKVETIYKNKQIIRQVKYEMYTFSTDKAMYIDWEITFNYHKNRLIKKVIKTMAHTAWCGQIRPEEIETYTYHYE